MSWLAIALVTALIAWAGVMWFAHFTTYPLFGSVPAAQFGALHARYERGLPVGVYAPFGAMVAIVVATALVRPPDVPGLWLGLAVIAVAGGIVTTAFGAAPLHIALVRDGLDEDRVRRLLHWNLARLVVACLGAVAAVGILAAQ